MKRGEEGFTLLEAVVGVGFLAVAVTGFMATIAVALHVVNAAKVNDAMDVVAHNALVDLYAVSAYDNGATAALLGQTRTYTVTQQTGSSAAEVSTYTVNVRVYVGAQREIEASVQVSDALGNSTAMHGILAQAAPAPGSTFTPTYLPASVRQAL
jgi:Tfp pilus assembly protein PilV